MIEIYVASVVHLLEDSCFEEKLNRLSDDTRKRKIESCKQKKDKARSLAAGILLEYAWKQKSGNTGKELLTDITEAGKPFCRSDASFFFNLSHSGMYVACAVAEEPIGVDIQKEKQVDLELAKRFFSNVEYKEISEANVEEKQKLFCEIWAIKESYIKYTGQGMQQLLNSFYYDRKEQCIIDENTREKAYIQVYSEIPEYQLAVCSGSRKCLKQPVFVKI